MDNTISTPAPGPASEADWNFGGQWPYEPRFFDSAEGRLHYVDEGNRDSDPVVLVHGNPTWGFLYRHFIPPLIDAGHRVIVPDHLGFGRSDKPSDPELYRIPRHVARLNALLESLDLRGATLVPQDWGGPIGLSWAVAHPERVARLFILNTYAQRPPGKCRYRCRCACFARRASGSCWSRGSTYSPGDSCFGSGSSIANV